MARQRQLHEVFGEVRALLASGAPSAWRWRFLCAALDEARDDVWLDEQVLPYVTRALAQWPDDLRVAPLDWLRRAGAGEAMPALRLARALYDVPELEAYQRARSAAWLRKLPQLDQITTLRIRADVSIEIIEGFLVGLPRVTALACSGGHLQGPTSRHPEVWRRLRRLRVTGGTAHNVSAIVGALMDAGACETLEALGLVLGGWHRVPRELFERARWSSLEALMLGRLHEVWPLTSILRHAPRLRALELLGERERHDVPWASALADSAQAAQLQALGLTDAALPGDLIGALPALDVLALTTCHAQAGAPLRRVEGRLRALRLQNTSREVCEALWHDPALERLLVGAVQAAPHEVAAWLAMPRLQRLDVHGWSACPIDALSPDAIVAPLVSCTLQHVWPSARALGALVRSACGATLQALQLDNAALSASRLRPLCEAPMPALEHLSLGGNHLGTTGLARIFDAPWFGQLRTLCLHDNGLPAEAFELWGIAPRGRIERLDWANCAVELDAEVAQALFASPALGELRILNLGSVPVSGGLARAVVEALPRLWALQLHTNDHAPAARFASPRLEVCALRDLTHEWRPDRQIRALRGTPWFDIMLCTPPNGGSPEALSDDHLMRAQVSIDALAPSLVVRYSAVGASQLSALVDADQWPW